MCGIWWHQGGHSLGKKQTVDILYHHKQKDVYTPSWRICLRNFTKNRLFKKTVFIFFKLNAKIKLLAI
jgi:hypothetical protein